MMQTLKELSRASRFQAMLPAAITERQALDAAIKRAVGSASFSRVLGSIVAECLSAEETGIVLPPPCAATLHHCYHRGDTWTSSRDGAGYACWFYRRHSGEDAGFWTGNESRIDSTGRTWSSRLERAVIDDFGDLVEVAS
jgi:hypothetical protein